MFDGVTNNVRDVLVCELVGVVLTVDRRVHQLMLT
jgi:hypothetical protein